MDHLFVTGTDTGIGKTQVSCALLHALRRQRPRAVGMKPLASGCELTSSGWQNSDAVALRQASNPVPVYADVNPYALPAPLAPEIAAREAGVSVDLQVIRRAFLRLQATGSSVVVEGVGGWAAPLSPSLDQMDLVRELNLSVVMVVGLRLGCINHARLTAQAIAADGGRLVGWVANEVDPEMARRDENFELLKLRLLAPCWGRLPYLPDASAEQLAAFLNPVS
ncbi:dethiobiotin synthase [Pseudoxanthomonas dokdonensis]|uniref:ATP-dependent dethiobiotin synthetase BioD n=1 Tax=Pseudoxanthomonas dokdonensis TaxID=344882 RepID=A0A0R0CPV7_9GAMM|nr:dethiobiotin synthase [Pseudoxanthomonas dokdonensis]KRG71621.1 dethiobiotin synthetase [Pseudoxanthomonas dokdonensis]